MSKWVESQGAFQRLEINRRKQKEMALEPTKHTNGRMWQPGLTKSERPPYRQQPLQKSQS
jgi:hypothetical protein